MTCKSKDTRYKVRNSAVSLNENTPCGLFISRDGNKYIVTDHNLMGDSRMFRVAVSLVHHSLLPFTWFPLEEQPSEIGYWCGPCRIRLLNALSEECVMGFPGVISTGDRHASIQCRKLDGSVELLSLGYVGRPGFEFVDFHGWVLESTTARECFFETGPRGDANLVLEPKWKRAGAAGLNNTLKTMLKEGIMEKSLARRNSTAFSYKLTDSFLPACS